MKTREMLIGLFAAVILLPALAYLSAYAFAYAVWPARYFIAAGLIALVVARNT